MVPHFVAKLGGSSHWPRRFLGGAATICGAQVRLTGHPPGPGELLISNHVSWLDIPVLAGATGCAFVSKAEVRSQPFLRWLADQNETIYVDRSERRAIGDQAQALRGALGRRRPLTLFPEGTVGDGGRLLPFKPSLLSAVVPPPPGVTLRPVAIDYGGRASELAWTGGEHGFGNFLRIIGMRGRLAVTVRLLPSLEGMTDRKVLARAAQASVEGALALSETPALPYSDVRS